MHVAALATYPIKSCHRLDHEQIVVEACGFAGDRRWLIVDDTRRFLTQREHASLARVHAHTTPDGLLLTADEQPDLLVRLPEAAPRHDISVWEATVPASPAGTAAAAWLTAYLGRPAALYWLDDPTRRAVKPAFSQPGDRVSFADETPVTIANAASMAALNAWVAGAPAPITRFRPNIVLGDAAAWIEDSWPGRRLRVGAVTFRVAKPASRCPVVNIDQETGAQRGGVLKALGTHRQVNGKFVFATHLIPETPGTISVGDPIEVWENENSR